MRAFLLVPVLCMSLAGCATTLPPPVSASPGLVTVRSAHDVEQTTLRLQAALDKAGMRQFGIVDHAAGASSVDLSLAPTRVIIFGNPKVGTPLMRCARTVAIDLPMKALIYEDADGAVWYAYNDPQYLKARHDMSDCDAVLDRVSGALAKFAAAATSAK